MSDFRTYEPKEFFEKLVKPTYEEYLEGPLQHHRVKNAVAQLDTMAERMWHWWHKKEPANVAKAASPRKYREYLSAKECSDFQIVWDMHDGHKHVELSRPNRRVTSAGQSGIKREGGAIGSAPIGAAPIGGTIDSFVVRLDDGTEHNVTVVIKNVMEMWKRILSDQ